MKGEGGRTSAGEPTLRAESPRHELRMRFDLLPGEGVRWAARAMAYGAVARGGRGGWRGYPVSGDKSPLNHAVGHLMEALDLPEGSGLRVWKLAKAAANVLMQISLETSGPALAWWVREKWPDAVRKGEERAGGG